jgi:sulfur-carrier protein
MLPPTTPTLHHSNTPLPMPTKVRIPTPLRQLTGGEEVVTVTAANVGAAIAEMQAKYPGIKDRLLDDKGEVRRFVNVYVNEEDIRFLQNQATPLKDGDEISIIPAIAGG